MSLTDIRRAECDQCHKKAEVGDGDYPVGWVELEAAVRQKAPNTGAHSTLKPVDHCSGDFCGIICAKAFLIAFAESVPAKRTDGICCLFCMLVDASEDTEIAASPAKAQFMTGGTTAMSFVTVYGLDATVAAMCPSHRRLYRASVDRAHTELNRDLS